MFVKRYLTEISHLGLTLLRDGALEVFKCIADKFLFTVVGYFGIVLVREKSCRIHLKMYQFFKHNTVLFEISKRYFVINIPVVIWL